ncbi:hypothetical protein HYT25_02420 [Candidatus Pacearchaeota archaeon]|nr:hypothetical protein [Candidatus Pacearchaeota archaeon]
MVQEIKNEKSFWDILAGNPGKEIITVDGEKVAEIRHETTWTGKPVDRVYTPKGEIVSETKKDTDWLGRDVRVTRDTGGKVISKQTETSSGAVIKRYDGRGKIESTTEHKTKILGGSVDVTRDSRGKVVSKTEHITDIYGRPFSLTTYKDERKDDKTSGRNSEGRVVGVSHHKRNLAEIVKEKGLEKKVTGESYSSSSSEESYSAKNKSSGVIPAILILGVLSFMGYCTYSNIIRPAVNYWNEISREYDRMVNELMIYNRLKDKINNVADNNKNKFLDSFEIKQVYEALGLKCNELCNFLNLSSQQMQRYLDMQK